VTTFCDGYFFEESALEAATAIGSRAVLGQGILDFPTPDQPDPKQARARAEKFLDHFSKNDGRLRPSLFCHAPYTCSAETLQWVKQLCRQQGILFQIHLSETAAEAAHLTEQYGARPVSYLDRLGLLDDLTLCAHAIWLQDEEIELLAKSKTGISHNVESNMKLASGVAPVPAMLKAGVCVALGTDGCASNNDLDLFSEMDKVAKLHKVMQCDPVVCSAPEVLKMATVNGASALGWKDQIGSLEVGKQADIITIDLFQPHLVPLYDPISQIVYAARGSDVRCVWVGGDMVVADGRVQTVEPAEVLREVRKIAERIKGC
jgi:5-methylthioadenosine/S-adenosylhomocysteine deaminase